ncbi:MAG TPA: phosphotransferase [Candidatus Limnocylindrales bacterium]|nr:phosphotransferase [Candidatus Limnocylindrales bacterium]
MSGTSKSRLLWPQLPATIQAEVGRIAGGRIVAARNCPGGFSPGLASRLRLDNGRRVFVKAMDGDAWPHEAVTYRAELTIAAALPEDVPAPRLHGTFDDGRWIVLVFEDVDGLEPSQPWTVADLRRVVPALEHMSAALTPSPVAAPADHPRLGGWAELAADAGCLAKLVSRSPWAVENLDRLIHLEQRGLAAAATGNTLLHFDTYAHNILLAPQRVWFVDWPHARLGHPLVDLVLLLSSAAADGIDPEPFVAEPFVAEPSVAEPSVAGAEQPALDGILAANAGFLLAGGLSEPVPGLEAIPRMKLHLGTGALGWLHRRLSSDG